MSSMAPSASAITHAVHSGIAYLSRIQRPTGEFVTLTGPALDMGGATPYPKSTYVPAFVIHSLGYVPANAPASRIRALAADFLEAEEESNGTWNYEGRGTWRLPEDLDSTCCAVAALVSLGRRPPRACYPLLWQVIRPNAIAPGGPYETYLGIREDPGNYYLEPFANDLDPLVNANILFCCGLLGIDLPGAAAWLRGIVEEQAFVGRSVYVISPHFLAYAIGRAYADGNVASLAPAMPALQRYVLTSLPPVEVEVSALNLACRAVTLLNLGADAAIVEPCVTALLRTQQADGGWPAWAAWAGFPPNYDGSPALSTALALEALGKYLGQQES